MRRRQPLKSNKLKKWLAAPYAVWAAGFIIIPLILILYYAFTGEEGGFTLSNFAYVATKENIKALGLALWLSLLSTALCLLLAYPLAMILANRNVNQTSFIVLIFILPMWMNFLLRTLAWQTLLEKNGVINSILAFFHLPGISIINTPGAIILGMVYNFLPFMVLPIYNVLIKIDRDVINAARDLGANSVQTFLKVTLPLTTPGIVSGITMVFIPALTTFVISDLLGGSKILLIGNVIEQEFKQTNNWNAGSALSTVLMIFIILSMVLMNKYDKDGEGNGILRKKLEKIYMALIFILLYAPIVTLVVLSFNDSKTRAKWGGFTLHWYRSLFANTEIMNALYTTLIIALLASAIATVLGTLACIGINSMSKKSRTVFMGITNIRC